MRLFDFFRRPSVRNQFCRERRCAMTIDKFLDSINDETTAQEIMSMFRNLNYMNKIEVILYHHDELGLPVDAVFVAMYLRQFRPIIPAWMSLDNESSRSIQETLSGVREVEINTVSDVLLMMGYQLYFDGDLPPVWAMRHVDDNLCPSDEEESDDD